MFDSRFHPPPPPPPPRRPPVQQSQPIGACARPSPLSAFSVWSTLACDDCILHRLFQQTTPSPRPPIHSSMLHFNPSDPSPVLSKYPLQHHIAPLPFFSRPHLQQPYLDHLATP